MATTNLGRVKPIHRGVYDPDFLYTPLDIVRYQGASYFCIKASQGNVPQDGEYFMAIVDGDLRYAQTAGGADANFAEAPQIDGQSLDDRYQAQEAGKGLSANDYSDNEKAKLEGIESAATKNDTDAQLRDRSTHTGTQTLDTIRDAGTAAARNVEDFDAAGSAAQALASAKSYTESYADPAGSASGAIASHEQAQNPHPQYARLAEPNDFAHMPTVGGAPVVESGSNSDGEWTRWADGTQICSGSLPESKTWEGSPTRGIWYSNTGAKPLPKAFSKSPLVVSQTRDSQVGSRGAYISNVSAGTASINDTWYVSPSNLSLPSDSPVVLGAYIAMGYWK